MGIACFSTPGSALSLLSSKRQFVWMRNYLEDSLSNRFPK